MAQTQVFKRFIKNILRTILIDCIVGQMHIKIVKIVLAGRLVLLSRKSYQPFIIDIEAERVTACY